MHGDAQDCAEKNIHNWTQEKIQKVWFVVFMLTLLYTLQTDDLQSALFLR